MTHVPPSVRETAFNCPHCGALSKQFWYSLQATGQPESKPLPLFVDAEARKEINVDDMEDADMREKVSRVYDALAEGRPFLGEESNSRYGLSLYNAYLSRCFNCKDISIWIYDRLVYPQRGEAALVNPDLPSDIRRDYDEASSILDLSPRGAAALIRLAIQKLCKELGQSGKDLNADIGVLVADGLDVRIQKGLDVVRVVGNNAVHPGQMDLRDDRATAEILFRLLNLIAEKMISEPRHIDQILKDPHETRPQSRGLR